MLKVTTATLMLQRLADLKRFVQDLGSYESYLTESEWAEVKMMVEVLQMPHAATIYFRKQYPTPGECLLHWKEGSLNRRSCRQQSFSRFLLLEVEAIEKSPLPHCWFLFPRHTMLRRLIFCTTSTTVVFLH